MRDAVPLPRTRSHVAEQHLWLYSLRARLSAARLDRDLASGVASWSSVEHAARARQITSSHQRALLSRRLERLLLEARYPRITARGLWGLEAMIRPPHRSLLRCADSVGDTVDVLRSPGPVNAEGVARLRRLLASEFGDADEANGLETALQHITRLMAIPG